VKSGYIGILSFDVHFPESHSLKGKRHELLGLKQALQRRLGAAVAEVDGHELWQRSRLTLALVDRRARDCATRLDEAERLVLASGHEAGPFQRELVSPTDLEP